MARQTIDIPGEELVSAYLAGWSTPALAQRYACSPATIAKRLRAAGLALRDARFRAVPVAEAALRRLYLDEQLPIAAIAAALGVSASTVGNKRRAYGIPIRPRPSTAAVAAPAAPEQRAEWKPRRVVREARLAYRYAAWPA
jgi:hypothetical protein